MADVAAAKPRRRRIPRISAAALPLALLCACTAGPREAPPGALPSLARGTGYDLPKALFQGRLARRGACVGLASGDGFTTIVWPEPMTLTGSGDAAIVANARGTVRLTMGQELVGSGGSISIDAMSLHLATRPPASCGDQALLFAPQTAPGTGAASTGR